ncbi:hypothetical protein DIR46_00480 [Massilia oculi]|uniref:Uncharacterized protein n=1 Tax=Massilia oculi TaxID=945844 RepID=A0A2S2DCL0_9BURK|nr:hypothetical protein DIR46_00480 [Massilia oculi]
MVSLLVRRALQSAELFARLEYGRICDLDIASIAVDDELPVDEVVGVRKRGVCIFPSPESHMRPDVILAAAANLNNFDMRKKLQVLLRRNG